jgi:hypothetical protein
MSEWRWNIAKTVGIGDASMTARRSVPILHETQEFPERCMRRGLTGRRTL